MTETVITRNALMKKIRNGLIYRCNADETSLFEFNLMIPGLIFTLRCLYASRGYWIIAPGYPEFRIRQGLNPVGASP